MADNPIDEQRAPKRADPEKDAESFKHEVLTKLEAWFRVSPELRENVQTAFEMTIGGKRQWRQDDRAKLESERRPVQAFNICHPTVNFLAGYQSERDTDYRAFPRGSEDEQLGRDATAFMKYAMDVGGGGYQQHAQFRKGAIGGLSVMEIGHSFDFTDDLIEGDVAFTVLPQNAWACDAGARRYDRNDAWWQDKLIWMNREDLKRHPRWKDKTSLSSFQGTWDNLGADLRLTGVPEQLWSEYYSQSTNQIRILQHWYKVPVKVVLVVDTATQEILKFTSEKEAEKFLKGVRDQMGQGIAQRFKAVVADTLAGVQNMMTGQIQAMPTLEDADAWIDTMRKQAGSAVAEKYNIIARDATALKVAHMTAWDVLENGPSPYLDDWRYPFSPFIPYQDTDDLYAIKGIIFDIIDPQREINWNHSTLQDELVRGPKSGWWLPKDMEAQVAELQEKIHRSGFMGTYTTTPPQPIQPQPISQGFMQMLMFDVDAVMRITSINAELVGQTTQKTVSGRAIAARQSGGLVGLASLMNNWRQTRELQGKLILKRITQFYSEAKMLRILGDNQQVAKAMGILGLKVEADAMLVERFKRLKNTDFDIRIDFQESTPTARAAVLNQLLQLRAAGFPVPPDIILEAGDFPFKQELKDALSKQNNQLGPPDEALAKVLSAGQGQGPSQPDGVNAS